MAGGDRLRFESSCHLHNHLLVISFSMECPEAMERGRNFRLLTEEELPRLLDFLAGYLPESLKVRAISLWICSAHVYAKKFRKSWQDH